MPGKLAVVASPEFAVSLDKFCDLRCQGALNIFVSIRSCQEIWATLKSKIHGKPTSYGHKKMSYQ